MRDGLRLAATTFTIAPVRPGRVDRGTAAVAMAVAPVVGALLGLLLGAVLTGLRLAHAPPVLAGALAVALEVLLTRGLHVDGLADTVDALGSYRDRDAALTIMRSPEVGPFGVAAVGLVLLIQATALGAIGYRPATAAIAGVTAAVATGRYAVTLACRRGVPAARPDGLGALVAGTVAAAPLIVDALLVAALAVPAVPARLWQGPLAVTAGLAAAALLVRHAVRRFGGITGDVLGAAVEVATTVTLVGLVLG
ncbi:MAG TPA: adenosylcobinamide-GDP ribazoletransferase [Micromonosporaceae bacterium]